MSEWGSDLWINSVCLTQDHASSAGQGRRRLCEAFVARGSSHTGQGPGNQRTPDRTDGVGQDLELVSTPGLRATVVVDRATSHIMRVTFRGRRT
jgi:hypothetical protein